MKIEYLILTYPKGTRIEEIRMNDEQAVHMEHKPL